VTNRGDFVIAEAFDKTQGQTWDCQRQSCRQARPAHQEVVCLAVEQIEEAKEMVPGTNVFIVHVYAVT